MHTQDICNLKTILARKCEIWLKHRPNVSEVPTSRILHKHWLLRTLWHRSLTWHQNSPPRHRHHQPRTQLKPRISEFNFWTVDLLGGKCIGRKLYYSLGTRIHLCGAEEVHLKLWILNPQISFLYCVERFCKKVIFSNLCHRPFAILSTGTGTDIGIIRHCLWSAFILFFWFNLSYQLVFPIHIYPNVSFLLQTPECLYHKQH